VGARYPGATLAQFGLQPLNELGLEDVLDHIGVAVDVARGDVGVGDEIDFPETVISSDACGFTKSCLRELEITIGNAFKVSGGRFLADDSVELGGFPGAFGEEGSTREGQVADRGAVGRIRFEDLKCGAQ